MSLLLFFAECPCPVLFLQGQKCPIVQSWETTQFRGCNYIKGILFLNFHGTSKTLSNNCLVAYNSKYYMLI